MLNMELNSHLLTVTPMGDVEIEATNLSAPEECQIISPNSSALDIFTHISEAYIEQAIFASGIVTNILAFATLRQMPISKAVKALLCTFCITDFLTSIFGFSTTLLEIVWFCGDMVYGEMVPGVIPIFTTYKIYLMFLGMSSAILIFTSIMRTYSIINPFEWRNTFSKRRTVKLIFAITIGMFVAFLPTSLYIVWKACFIQVEEKNNTIPNSCQILEEYHVVSVGYYIRYYFGLIGIILGPGTVAGNIVCFVLLKRAINKSYQEIVRMQNPNNDGEFINSMQLKKSMNVNKMFFAVLIINTVCIAPSCAQVVCLLLDPIEYIFNKSPAVAVIDIVAEVFLSVLSSYNFWLYLIINKDFRQKFKKIFCCTKTEKTVNSTESWHRVSRRVKHITEVHTGLVSGTPV